MRARLAIWLRASSAVLMAAPVAHAQSTEERPVRAVVDSFFTRVSREDWHGAATLLDLVRFESFLKTQVAQARSALPTPPMTADMLMVQDSTMPRAVAEWEAERSNRFARERHFDDYSHEFAGITSQRDLFALTVPDAAARWLQAKDIRSALRESMRRGGCPLAEIASVPPVVHRILAVGRRDDSTTYVVHTDDLSQSAGPYLIGGERVMVLHRGAGGWAIEPREDLLGPLNMAFDSDCAKR
jgi:hypothetical protein